MPRRRALFGWAIAGALSLSGCGWTPIYADRETEPTDEDLRAIRVAPIAERIGQRLALALRESLNPGGEQAKQRYVLNTTLQVVRLDLGIQSQGLGTRGRVEVYGTFALTDLATNARLMTATSHVAESFDIVANIYSTLVAEEDARNRAVEELRRDIVSRLSVFFRRRAAERAGKPAAP